MVVSLAKEPSTRLLKHVVRCYLRLSDNPRYVIFHIGFALHAISTYFHCVAHFNLILSHTQFSEICRARWMVFLCGIF